MRDSRPSPFEASRWRWPAPWPRRVLAPDSDHVDGGRFFNPTGTRPLGRPLASLTALRPRRRRPAHLEVSLPHRRARQVAVAFVNHATFLLQSDAGNVLTDPVWASPPLSGWRPLLARAPYISLDASALPPIHLVLLSHEDPDHLDLPTLTALARRHDPLFVTGLRAGRRLRARGLRVLEQDWWQVFRAGSLCVTMTPARHGSGRFPMYRDRSLWGGFVIETAGTRVFFAGDTGYASHFRAVRGRCGVIDLALLPVQPEAPDAMVRDARLTVEEAVRAHGDLQARRSVAMQCWTGDAHREADRSLVRALHAALSCRGISPDVFRIPRPGESTLVACNTEEAGGEHERLTGH